MHSERIEFSGHEGSALAARLDLPEGPVRATALFAHCFTCSKDIPAARRIAGRLAARGIAVLRFDFTGLGHSGGEFANTGFSSNVADLVKAAEYLEGRDMAPQLLIGHSLGGAAAIKVAAEIPGLKALVTIAAPADPEHVLKNFGDTLEEIRDKGTAEVSLAGRRFEIRREFIEDIEASSLDAALPRLGAALLVLHSPIDSLVDIDNAATIFQAAKHPKSFVTLDDADHLISREADAEYAADVIVSWSSRYLELAAEPTPEAVPEGLVRVAEADPEGLRQDVVVGGKHSLVVDEPENMGGSDLGPTPYQFLSAGLGACTAMTIRLYARHKKIPLEHVDVEVSHNKAHGEECEHCEETPDEVDVFRRQIRLEGELTEEQRERLLAIADKCPVHRTLHEKAVIETALA